SRGRPVPAAKRYSRGATPADGPSPILHAAPPARNRLRRASPPRATNAHDSVAPALHPPRPYPLLPRPTPRGASTDLQTHQHRPISATDPPAPATHPRCVIKEHLPVWNEVAPCPLWGYSFRLSWRLCGSSLAPAFAANYLQCHSNCHGRSLYRSQAIMR